jgi:homoserine acetyltransferase
MFSKNSNHSCAAKSICFVSGFGLHRELNFNLDSGTYCDLQARYYQFGNPNGPVVVINAPLSASCLVALPQELQRQGITANQQDGWWQSVVGPGACVNTDKFRIIAFDHLLGRKYSAGEASTTSALDRPDLLGQLTPFDTARFAARSLKHTLGLDQVHAVIGASLGGASAAAWAEASLREGVSLNKIISVAGSIAEDVASNSYFNLQLEILTASSSFCIKGLKEKFIEQIQSDFRNGSQQSLGSALVIQNVLRSFDTLQDCIQQSEKPILSCDFQRVALARKLGLLRFVTPEYFDAKHLRLRERGEGIEQWLDQQADSYAAKISKLELYGLLSQICCEDFETPRLAESIRLSGAEFLYHALEGDILFDPQAAQSFVARLKCAGVQKAECYLYSTGGSNRGHDYFLCHEYHTSSAAKGLQNQLECL